jgi:hypothetical protein
MGNFTTAVKNEWLDSVTSTTLYMSLFVGDPTDSGVEISGANYARVEVPSTSWGDAAAGALSNTTAITFPKATGIQSSSDVTYFGLYTAATGGDLKFYDDLPAAQQQPIVENNTVSFAIGDIDLTVSDLE